MGKPFLPILDDIDDIFGYTPLPVRIPSDTTKDNARGLIAAGVCCHYVVYQAKPCSFIFSKAAMRAQIQKTSIALDRSSRLGKDGAIRMLESCGSLP